MHNPSHARYPSKTVDLGHLSRNCLPDEYSRADNQITMQESKSTFMKAANRGMQDHLHMPDWTDVEKVALTCRILFKQGQGSGLAGQITARHNVGSCFLTQQFGLGFDEIDEANILLVNENLEVLKGSGMPNPANRFHSWIYRARPDVHCIVHTHSLHIAALSMIGQPLKIAHMDSCIIYNEVAFLDAWPGVPLGDSEGEIISAALGRKRALLLAHHGMVAVGRTIEEACVIALQCERAAQLQLLATAAGDIHAIAPKLGEEARDWLSTQKRVQATFCHAARQILMAPNNLSVSVKNKLLDSSASSSD